MRKSNEQSIGEVIKDFLKTNHLEEKFDEASLEASWEKIMGKTIAKHTTEIKLYKRKLYISLNSAVLRNELNYAREKIIKNLNEEFGKNIVNEVIIK